MGIRPMNPRPQLSNHSAFTLVPGSFDARVWARAFFEAAGPGQVCLSEEDAVTWFANALMRGFDEAESRRLDAPARTGGEGERGHSPERDRATLNALCGLGASVGDDHALFRRVAAETLAAWSVGGPMDPLVVMRDAMQDQFSAPPPAAEGALPEAGLRELLKDAAVCLKIDADMGTQPPAGREHRLDLAARLRAAAGDAPS